MEKSDKQRGRPPQATQSLTTARSSAQPVPAAAKQFPRFHDIQSKGARTPQHAIDSAKTSARSNVGGKYGKR